MFSQFKSAVDSRDLSRQNRYRVNVGGLSQEENMLCTDVTLPMPNLITTEYKHQGPALKIPYDVVYGDLQMTFMTYGNDNQPQGKFVEWIESVFDENYRFNDKADYQRTVIVQELDRSGSVTFTHTYYEAFPTMLGPKPKSMAAGAPDIITVNFQYLYSTHA